MSRKIYKFNKVTGKVEEIQQCQVDNRLRLSLGEIEPFVSPVTDEIIASRTQLREHIKRHNLMPTGNQMPECVKRVRELEKRKC